jgi:hypothetical protein
MTGLLTHSVHADTGPCLSEFAWTLAKPRSLSEAADAVVAGAIDVVPGAVHASLTLVGTDGRPHTAAATSIVARSAAALQYAVGDGPCLSAMSGGAPVVGNRRTISEVWPHLEPVLEAGIDSMLSLPLGPPSGPVGALNLSAQCGPGRPTAIDADRAEMVAAIAFLAVSSQLQALQFREAVESRDVIGQAKGILMERYHLPAQEAFQLLVRSSQKRHLKLRELAQIVTETGEHPGGTPSA